jgi:spermidine synthase
MSENLTVTKSTGSDGKTKLRFIILAFFLLSGASGLIYEIVWNRMLTLVFGSTVFATATVLTSYMAGMSIGSFYFGRLIDRRGNPLKAYAYMEAGIGIFAVFLPFILIGVEAFYVAVHRTFQTSFYLLSLVKFLLCLAVLIIPTTLMGGTLPVISKFFTHRMDKLGRSIGVLYGVNTFGAVLGCFFAGFVFIRTIGVSGTIYIAASINIIISIIILIWFSKHADAYTEPKYVNETQNKVSVRDLPIWTGKLALWVVAISGFCALAYEVLWTRVLTLFLGSTTYAFTTMLSAFLCGIAIGSFIMARLIDVRKDVLIILSAVQIGIALSALLMIPVYGRLYSIGAAFTKPGWWNFLTSRFALSFSVMLVPTILMGMTLPLVSKIYTRSLSNIGQSIGNVYSINTIGSILGSFLAGFILIPYVGIQRTIILIAFINATAGAIVAVMRVTQLPSETGQRPFLKVIPLGIAILAVIISSIAIDVDQPLTRFTAIFKGLSDMKLLFYQEGIDASVTVVEDEQGMRRAFVDANQAAEDSRWDLPSHSVIGHLPIIFHPEPENALVIGFGMGVTSWSISRHDVKVDAIEISQGIVEANKYFTKINHNVLDEPLVNLIVDDGRNYVITTDKKYDMISTGIIHPLVSANSASFYTIDFYELCKEILTDDGIMCQWVPLHRLPEKHYKMIIRTFQAAFPHTTIWYKYTPDFSILIGTPKPLSIDYMDFKSRIQKNGVKEDLALVNMDDPIALLDSFMMDEETVKLYAGDGVLHTDNRPRMEFFGTKMGDTTSQNILGMKKHRKTIIPYLYNLEGQEGEVTQQLRRYYRATEYTISGQLFYVKGDFDNAIRQYNMALDINPRDENTKWLRSHIESIMENEAIDQYKEIIRQQPDSATAHAGLGLLYQKRGMIDEAIEEMKTAIQLDPGIAVARINLGAMYQKKGMIDEAIEQFIELVETGTNSAVIHGRLGDLYKIKGDYSRAETEFKKALEIDPTLGLIYHSLANLYLEQGDKIDAALEYAKEAVRLNPAPNFLATLAKIYYQMGMYTDAEEEIKRAIDLEPDNKSYQDLLNKIKEMEK